MGAFYGSASPVMPAEQNREGRFSLLQGDGNRRRSL